MPEAKGLLSDRIALITGASRGIGSAAATRFAAEGAHVILVARTVGGLEEVDDKIRELGGTATLVPLDLTRFQGIDELGATVAERFGRLDILVGNAAMLGLLGPLAHIDAEVWDQVMALNLTVNWRLIRSFDPLLRESDGGRVIFVTSGVATGVFPYWGPYAVSKAALEMLTRVYAGEVAKTRIRVNLFDPGAARTRMRAEAFPGEDPESLPPPETVIDALVELASPACRRHGEVVRAS
ncbi:MAG: SDR family NAD(P)-dependent oxidoreductase [Alphaproteobacteria bacterium]